MLGLAASIAATVLLALPAGASSYDAKLKRYPYLTDLVGTSVIVNWATDISLQTGVVKYGQVGTESCTAHTAAPATKTFVFVNGVSEYQWKSQLTGLAADTQYCYRVYYGTAQIDLLGADPSPNFRTQIPSGSTTPYSFAVFGDWGKVGAGGQNTDQSNVIAQIASSGARFAVTTGNNAYDAGSQKAYGDLYQTGTGTSAVFGPNYWKVAGASVPLFPALGNRDTNSSVLPLNWPQDTAVATSGGRYTTDTYCCLNGTTSGAYPSAWYAFDAGPARFYVLDAAWDDSNLGTADAYKNDFDNHWAPGTPQWEWLKNDLQTNPRSVRFAFFHYPMYTDNNSPASDTYLRGATSLEGLLKANNVTVAFNAHSHQYQRNSATADGVPSYVTGGGGATLEPIGLAGCHPPDQYGLGWRQSPKNTGSFCPSATKPSSKTQVHHFLLVSVKGTSVTVTPIDELGRPFDQFVYGPPAPPADLALTKASVPTTNPVWPGDPVNYDLNVQNNGPNAADGVRVTDTLPTGATVDSATASQGTCLHASGVVSCVLGTLANGGAASVQIKVRLPNAGTITNQATVTSSVGDPNSANNSASADTDVTPVTGYARPRGASPFRISLVPAFSACTASNSTHGGGLAFGSCAPPGRASTNLTVGTPDVDGAQANFVGTLLLKNQTNNVAIRANLTDVRCGTVVSTCGSTNVSSGADYTGELQATYALRLTDREGGITPSTVSDTSFPMTIVCGQTASAVTGATCAVTTTANAILPGSVQAGNRAIWQIGQVHVNDGGPDGVVSTTPNGLFAVQGVFVP